MHDITVRRRFLAWHRLRHHGEEPRAPHRHLWEVRATVHTPELGPAGFGVDFNALDGYLGEVLAGLEGRVLNELGPFREVSPSAERLAEWVFANLTPHFTGDRARLIRVEVFEGPRFSAACGE